MSWNGEIKEIVTESMPSTPYITNKVCPVCGDWHILYSMDKPLAECCGWNFKSGCGWNGSIDDLVTKEEYISINRNKLIEKMLNE